MNLLGGFDVGFAILIPLRFSICLSATFRPEARRVQRSQWCCRRNVRERDVRTRSFMRLYSACLVAPLSTKSAGRPWNSLTSASE